MALQNPRKVCDRQNRRHPDLVSLPAGQLIRWRALERDLQAELAPWQRKHVNPPAVPPPRRKTYREGRYTRALLSRPHDHWPVRPVDPPLRKEWGVEWLPSLVLDGVLWPMRLFS